MNLLGIILFGICKFSIFRFCSHFAWFFLTIVIILTFFIGSLYAIVGILGQDLSISFKYLFFNSAQIYSLFNSTSPDAAKILDCCLNSNGDLANRVFNLSNSNVTSIVTLQNASTQLGNLAANISGNSRSITIPQINSLLGDFNYNIGLLNVGDPSSPLNVTIAWYSWSDSLTPNAIINKCPNTLAKERWAQNSSLCSPNYPYYSRSNSSNVGVQSCFVLSDWDATVKKN